MGKLTGVYKASDLNAKKKEEKTAARTGSGGASISGVYNAAGLKAKGQQLKEIKKEQNKKAISEREPMTYNEGDALTNPLYVGKGSTWKGAESFANLNKLNVNGAEELAERKQIRENNVRIRQLDREIEQAKTEKTKQTQETKTAFGTLPAAGREKNVQDAAKIANYTDVTALQAEKNRLVNKNQRLGVGVKTYEDKQQYDRIVKNGDEALFSKLFDLDYSEQGGRLSGAFLAAQGITQNNGASFQQWNRIAEELNSKGYDVNKAYAAYKNERLRQETEEEKEQFGQFAAAHPVAATALGVATAPIRGTAGVIGMAMEPGQANSPYQLFNTYSGAVTEKVGEISNQTVQTLAKMTGLNGGAAKALGKGAQWIYNAGVASLESLLTMETGGPLGELLMASGAASQAYNEALNNGLDNAHALGTSVLAGVFEAAFEHISLEKLRGLQAADAPGLKTAIINVLKQFLTEGSEEVFTDVANELADYLLNGGLSNYERTVSDYMKNGMTREQANAKYAGDFGWQLVESMAVGGISGAMSAGKIQTAKVASEAVENYGIGKHVQKEAKAGGTSVQDVLSPLAGQLDSESKGSRMLAAVNEKSKPGKIGKAATQAMYEMREANRETIAEAFRASGMESEKAGKAAEMYNKFINKEALTGEEWKLFTDGDVQDVIAELVKEGSTLANRQAAYKEFEQNVLDAVRRNAPGRKVAEKLEKQFGDGEVVKAVKTGDILKASDKALKNDRIDEDLVNTTEVKTADGKAQARQIAGLTDGDLDVVVDESGATEKLENINFGEDEAALKTKAAYIMLRDMMAGKEDFKTPLNATAANLALALWQNADAATNEKVSQASFLRQFYSAYVAGSVLADIKTLGVNESYTLPAEVLDVAYKAGAKQYELKPGVTNISRNVLNAVQQAEMYLLDMDAQKTGKRYLFHSEMEDYGYDDKSKAAVTYKLYGSTSGNDIIIALKTGEVENILTLTAGHETFHWIGTIDRNAQRALTNMVIEHLKSRSDIDYDAIYEQRARAYEGQSREFIEEEIAAQYFGTLWADKGFQRRMAKTDVKLAQRVLDYIKQFFERIHERIMEYAEKTGDKTIKAALLTEETEARKQLKAFEGVIEHVLEEQKAEQKPETEEKTEKQSRILDQAFDEQYEARQEVSALERQIRDIEQSEEFNKVMDALAAGLSGENFEEALEQYNRYAEQSGYAELTAKIADARERVKTAEQNYNEVFSTEAAEAERAAIEKSGLTEAEYFRKAAVKEFGTTSDWREAGYMTEDGRLLNFSGEKNMHRGNRGQDHRGIGIIFEDTHGSEAMYRFMRYGNIRVIAETPGVDICTITEPTAQQYAKIKDMVRRFAGEKFFNVDLTDENGLTAGALEYEGNVSADRVVNDIKHYFETGEIREQSSIEKFRYSKVLDQAYEKAVDAGDEAKQAALVEQAAKAAGYKIKAYHGTGRADRVGNVFLPERATSGPMAFFTDDRTIAEGYAKSKQDTSIQYDERYDNYESQFRTGKNGSDEALIDVWNRLPLADRRAIREKAEHIREDWDEGEGYIYDPNTNEANGGFQWQITEARGNIFRALCEQWLNSGTLYQNEREYLKVLDMIGVNDVLKKNGYDAVRYLDPDEKHEKVYDVYLGIRKPFDATKQATEAFADAYLEWYDEQDTEKYNTISAGADLWDKNNVDAESFAERIKNDVAQKYTHAWTSIPDSMTDYLKSLGYDGIKDTGGKFGGEGHTVWIPFNSNQVKSADPVTYDDDGNVVPLSERFNPEKTDIRYSRVLSGAMTEERVDYLIRDSGAGSRKDYAQKWITSINPTDFINLTTKQMTDRAVFDRAPTEYGGTMNTYDYMNELKENIRQTPFLEVNAATGEVIGHEGRHRMRSLEREGVTSVPVVIEYYDEDWHLLKEKNGYGNPLETIAAQHLINQFGSGYTADVENVIPIMQATRQQIIDSYGGDADVKYSRMLNANAVEYVNRITNGSRQYDEITELLGELATDTYEEGKARLTPAKLTELAKKYNFTGMDRKELQAFAERLGKADAMLGDGENADTVLYGLYRIMREQVINAGHYEDTGMDNVKEFRREFRVNGHAINLYIPADVQTDVAEYYGGKAALRRTMFGKMNIVYDQSKANSSLDEFYQELLAKNYGLEETTDPTTQLNNLLGLYSADTRVWMNDTEGLGLAGESVEEIATDKAVQLMTDMLTAGRKSASVKENAARIDKLLTKEQQNRAEGISSVITKADERLQKRLAALEQSELDTIEIERERERLKAENRLQTIREAYRQRLVQEQRRYAEEKQKEALAKDVKRNLKALSDRFLKESDALHVPEDLKKSVMEFVRMFEMDRTMLTANAMYNLNRIAGRLTQSRQDETEGETQAGDEDLMGRFDADIRADIEELAHAVSVIENERNGRKIYTSMLTLDEMRKLSNIMEHIRFLVESANEAFINGKKQKVSALSDKLIDDLKGKHPKLVQRLATVDGFINNKMLTPVYFFREKIGSTMREIYDDFRDGQDEWYRRVAEGGKMLHDAKEKYHYKEWKDDKKHFHLDATLEQDAWDVDLSIEAIMQIYVTAKREVAAGMDSKHLMTGGIVLADEAKLKSKSEKLAAWLKNAKNAKGLTAKGLQAEIERQAEAFEKEQNAERRQITLGKLIEIGDMLTDEQKAYADAVVKFMSTTCSDWGNGATMQLSGIKKFTEQYYFPFQSAKNYLHTSLGVMDDTRLKNAGFTKRTVHGAASPLVISGFTDVAASHIEQMALFSTMTVPLDNLSRVYNYQATSIDEKGNITKAAGNVKTAIQNAYGKAALDYINTFVRGVNGGLRSNSLDNMWNKATSMFKRAAVTGNASVVIQQPTSLMRAMALINPRYFLGVPRIGDYKNMMEHAPVAGIKKMGGFDTNTGRSAVDFMIDEQTTLQKATEWLNIGAEAADMVTWTNIWNAVRRETSHEHPDLEYGSDAYYKQCYARFRDIIDYTQVYDSTLSKSELMRDPGGLTKMITAFMAEPTLSFNMLTQSGMHRNGRTVNKGAAIVAFLFNIVVNSAFQSIVGAWRDKDEGLTFREKWLKRFFGNLVGDYNVLFLDGAWSPAGMIPWVKDLVSKFQGYDVDRSDISVFSDLFGTIQDVWGKIEKKEKLTYEDYLDAVGVISQFTPVPIPKILQDGEGIWNSVDRWLHSGLEQSREMAKQAILDGLGFKKKEAEKAYAAMIKNNAEYNRRKLAATDEEVQAYIDKGFSEELARANAETDRKTKLRNLQIAGVVAVDERAEMAAEARYERDRKTYENLIDDMEDDGIDRNAAIGAVDQLFKKLFPEDTEKEKEIKDKALYTTEDLKLAMEAIDVRDFNYIAEQLGYDEDTREQKARKYAENVYEDTADYNKALTILDELGGLSYNEAKAKVDYWKYIALNEDSDVSESAFTKYDGTGLGDLGVTLETWGDAYSMKQNTKGEDLNGDGKTDKDSAKNKVLAWINSLTQLSRTQKNALYRALEYAESKIGEAPWNK